MMEQVKKEERELTIEKFLKEDIARHVAMDQAIIASRRGDPRIVEQDNISHERNKATLEAELARVRDIEDAISFRAQLIELCKESNETAKRQAKAFENIAESMTRK